MLQPRSVQLLPNHKILLLSNARLTICNVPTLSMVDTLDALTLSEVNSALWSLDLQHGPSSPTISKLWVLDEFSKGTSVACTVCIVAPASRYTIRIPTLSALPFMVDHSLFAGPTLKGCADVALSRAVIKSAITGMVSLAGRLEDWVEVDNGVAKLRTFNAFYHKITGGKKPVGVTDVTFDQGSGRVCALHWATNDMEILYF